MFSRIIALSKPFNFQEKNVMIAFDYTYWDFYGDTNSPWIRGWTGENGIKGKFYFLTASMVKSDFRLPLISIPSTVLDTTAGEIISIMNILKGYFKNIDLLLLDRWFYSKEIIMSLNSISNYLIFVRKDSGIKRELESMEMGEKKIKLHEFSMYRDGKRITAYIAFLKKIFDHKTEEYYDWAFATNLKEVNLDEIIGKYKIRWRIENM
ncbi:MAG: transposase, partial [Thermoplasmatales archaeon]|nr:transposase [Thermoplasmatales archaeon]